MSSLPHTPQLFLLIPLEGPKQNWQKTKRTAKHTYKHATLPQLLLFSLSIYQSFIYWFLHVSQVFRMDHQNVPPSYVGRTETKCVCVWGGGWLGSVKEPIVRTHMEPGYNEGAGLEVHTYSEQFFFWGGINSLLYQIMNRYLLFTQEIFPMLL